jgi:hypothetical protein
MQNLKKIIIVFRDFLVSSIDFILELLFSSKPPKECLDAIGKPKKFDKIEIAQFDIPMNMTWEDACAVCDSLGEGWRLPTLKELKEMYKHRNRIGEFITEIEEDEEAELLYYWSADDYPADPDGQAYYVRFDNGYYDVTSKFQDNLSFRPVRDIGNKNS